MIQRLRLPAFLCVFSLLLCALVAQPFANMGICDDGPYMLVAQTLARTGHVVYNGWSEAMLGWQLFLGAAFIKVIHNPFTAVRMSNLSAACVLAFLLQRIHVRCGVNERNAVLGTLAFILSPLYLMLSVTFMTDITGLLAVTVCLYGCLRALQTTSDRASSGWLIAAVATNAIGGTSRQLAWLGLLVMVPSVLWLLRRRRRVFQVGAFANLLGVVFVAVAVHWFAQQPYTEHSGLRDSPFHVSHLAGYLIVAFLNIPFLLLPLFMMFLPAVRRASAVWIAGITSLYLVASLMIHLEHGLLLPSLGDWVGAHGVFEIVSLKGDMPIWLGRGTRILFTALSIAGLLAVLDLLFRHRHDDVRPLQSSAISWKSLGILMGPFSVAYVLLLAFRAASAQIVDRYLLGLLLILVIVLMRLYQDRVTVQHSVVGSLAVAVMTVMAVTMTHNTFSLYRARVSVADELVAAGVPETSVDNGWEYNLNVELRHASHINFKTIRIPADAYTPRPDPPPGLCGSRSYTYTVHVAPVYGTSFSPTDCYGPTLFAPVHYSRWLAGGPGTLYVVHYLPHAP